MDFVPIVREEILPSCTSEMMRQSDDPGEVCKPWSRAEQGIPVPELTCGDCINLNA
jgi:hypothetical protein